MADSDSEDVPALPADTLAILQQFQQEQLEKRRKLEESAQNPHSESDDIEIEEDWQLSQFWYDETTAQTLAKEALRCTENKGRIALISCPTLYRPLVKLKGPECDVKLLEFDRRFSVYGESFIFYDYNTPLELPSDLLKSFDLVIADPPFLSEECLLKVAETIEWLKKDRVILCTGAVMQKVAEDRLHLRKCKFTPHHKNNLGNEFSCYSNYDMDSFVNL
ncbi:EEF1A lysine methyltransferase 1 [Frankliniella fusca]|uniref:Protein-lysine N-methyltransferase KUF71_013650 n=1 Tax=Frankliniella fusca TaxID=407009 RepID=A0AAE1LMS9_9NEOP|nr:EEF1A lysine methyltransferase 1 [Frankliniella fusca]